ncbi:MAG: hypothetical protein HQL27_09540 [Candidatus Omnitrophica bacterium]|nr:hypothetical protein [Candidatus Omnitrophota bacterium]
MSIIKEILLKIVRWASKSPSWHDLLFLCGMVCVITFHPYYLYGLVNLFEAGLYLPGIESILEGKIPYKDFFHLRGPLELYLPAIWMNIFGVRFSILPSYFYLGTLATFFVGILIAKNLLKTRFFIYMLLLVLIARTFPRVSFLIGGGFRFAWGLTVIYCILRYCQGFNRVWLILAGIFSAVSLSTSPEIGIYSILSVLTALYALNRNVPFLRTTKKEIKAYVLSTMLALLPLGMYFYYHGALGDLLGAYYYVATNMVKTFPQIDPSPKGFVDVLAAMFNPSHVNFKHMTPLFCFAATFVYLLCKFRENRINVGFLCLAVYSFLIFVFSMRSLWGPAFESALLTEKILLFIIIERFVFYLRNDSRSYRGWMAKLLIAVVLISTLSYSATRFMKRFIFMQIIFCHDGQRRMKSVLSFLEKDMSLVDIPRMRGMVVPAKQASDITELTRMVNLNSKHGETVLFLPDLGIYNFITDRPYAGRFPVATLAWINGKWQSEFINSLTAERPRLVITPKNLPEYFVNTQLILPENKNKYNEVMRFVENNYRIMGSTSSFNVWVEK